MFFFSLGLMAGYVTLSPSQWANEKVIEPPRDRLVPPLPTTSRIVIVQRVETTLILNLTSLQNAIAVAFPLTIVEVVSLKKNCTATREITIAQRATFAMVAVHGASLAAGNAMFLPVGSCLVEIAPNNIPAYSYEPMCRRYHIPYAQWRVPCERIGKDNTGTEEREDSDADEKAIVMVLRSLKI